MLILKAGSTKEVVLVVYMEVMNRAGQPAFKYIEHTAGQTTRGKARRRRHRGLAGQGRPLRNGSTGWGPLAVPSPRTSMQHRVSRYPAPETKNLLSHEQDRSNDGGDGNCRRIGRAGGWSARHWIPNG